VAAASCLQKFDARAALCMHVDVVRAAEGDNASVPYTTIIIYTIKLIYTIAQLRGLLLPRLFTVCPHS